jgi:predicted nucleotidyltransferase
MKADEIQSLAREYGIVLIYLFGSMAEEGKKYLQGKSITPDDSSDIDISIAFENSPSDPMKIHGILYKRLSDIFEPFHIDLLFFHEVDPIFQYEIIKGVRIYEKDKYYADDIEEMIMKKAGDLIFKKRVFNQEIVGAIEDGYFEFEYHPHS